MDGRVQGIGHNLLDYLRFLPCFWHFSRRGSLARAPATRRAGSSSEPLVPHSTVLSGCVSLELVRMAGTDFCVTTGLTYASLLTDAGHHKAGTDLCVTASVNRGYLRPDHSSRNTVHAACRIGTESVLASIIVYQIAKIKQNQPMDLKIARAHTMTPYHYR